VWKGYEIGYPSKCILECAEDENFSRMPVDKLVEDVVSTSRENVQVFHIDGRIITSNDVSNSLV
jgi:hypothetical protein